LARRGSSACLWPTSRGRRSNFARRFCTLVQNYHGSRERRDFARSCARGVSVNRLMRWRYTLRAISKTTSSVQNSEFCMERLAKTTSNTVRACALAEQNSEGLVPNCARTVCPAVQKAGRADIDSPASESSYRIGLSKNGRWGRVGIIRQNGLCPEKICRRRLRRRFRVTSLHVVWFQP
jgi:hypothetical protein